MASLRTFGLIFEETVDLFNSSIEGTDSELMVGDVHDQILTHDGQPDEAKIGTDMFPRWSADVDAGKTGATVSPCCLSTFAPKVEAARDNMVINVGEIRFSPLTGNACMGNAG